MLDRKAAILLSVAATCIAVVSVVPQTRTLAITRVNIVNVIDGRIVRNSTVMIRGRTIATVAPNSAPRGDAQVVDGQGKFLIPGLWDMHAHMEMTGASWLQLYVANGVTGIRDMGSAVDVILDLRDATASGRVLGPRIFAAGPILDDAPGDWPFRMRVKTAEDGRAAVQLLKRRGVDLIKVHDHTPHDAFFAIAQEARRQHLPLAGHIPLGLTAEQVIDAGQGDIEHLPNQLWRRCSGGTTYHPEACRPFFEMLARRGVWQTPTLMAMSEIVTIGTAASMLKADRLAYAGKSLRAFWAGNQTLAGPDTARILKADAEVGAVVAKDMAQAGVGILAGCDSMIAGFCVHDELAAMVRGGMTPLAALQTATLNPARYFGLQQTAGSVAPGKVADLVLLDGNPLTDITHVQHIRAVVVAGQFLDRKKLDKLLAQVRMAARQPGE
ncbi:MAG TPA: amidohydrolase family protein [Vicinamibacterales bacterium]|nr:amidohydrolase family protein [Vicinamibacterales bacterium]